ncbi:unnamed protein product [Sphagnum troendelagicum]
MEGAIWRHHLQSVSPYWHVPRLVSRVFHNGCKALKGSDRSIYPASQRSSHLQEPDQHSRGVHPQSADCARSFRVIVESTNALFGALVDASKRAELYGTTDRSIDLDRLVYRSRISILEASTPNLLIVHDPLVSLLRAPMPCLEHWWMPQKELSFMALQTDRSIPIDWSVGAGSAFLRRPPPIC